MATSDTSKKNKKEKRDKKDHPLVKAPKAPIALVGMAAAMYMQGLAAAGLIAATTASVVSVAIAAAAALAQALIKPPGTNKSRISGTPGVTKASIRNAAQPNAPAQFCLGKNRVYPPLAAVTWTAQRGIKTWAHILLHVGDGEYDISDIKIGETALTSYPSSDYTVADGYITDSAIQAIYPKDVSSDATLPVHVTYASGGLIKTTAANTSRISVDVGCLNGLYRLTDSGNYKGTRIFYKLQYRTNSPQGSWINFDSSQWAGTKVFKTYQTGKSKGVVAWIHKVDVTPDTYDVQLIKTKADHPPPEDGDLETADDLYFISLRSIQLGSDPVLDENAYLLALNIRLDGNFSGNVDTINCIAEAKLPAWNGAAWTANATTRSPAWAFAAVLRGQFGQRLVGDNKIDGDALLTWANNCTTNGFYFDGIIGSETTAKQLLEEIASVGRASRTITDGKHSVVEDVVQATQKFHLSPRNCWDFRGHRDFLDYPHAFRCRYREPASGYQVEEIIVCDDGYYETVPSATTWASLYNYSVDDWVTPTTPNGYYYKCITDTGSSDSGEPGTWPTTPRETVVDDGITWMCFTIASEFEALDMTAGVTDSDQVWSLARYHLAVMRLRSETFTVNQDAENLRHTRGDRGALTYDVIQAGQGQARIKAIAGSDVTMDDEIIMVGGSTYGAIVAKADGTFLSASITLDIGTQTTIELSSVSGIAVGDLMFFGETGQIKEDVIIKAIESGPNHSAKITLTNYNDAIYTAATGTIPTYTPVISQPPEDNRVPPTITIESITIGLWPVTASDTADRQLTATVGFSLGMSTDIEPYYFQTQYRSYDTDDGEDIYSNWEYAPDVPLEARNVLVPVQDGSTFDFRVRAVSKHGITGDWDTYSDYAVSYAGQVPNDITNLGLRRAGLVWYGVDCIITWTLPADDWRVDRVKIEVYETSPLTLLHTEHVNSKRNIYSYTFAENSEDNDGSPVSDLTFRVTAISHNGDESSSYASIAVTHASPAAPTSLTGDPWAGGVDFSWRWAEDLVSSGGMLFGGDGMDFEDTDGLDFGAGAGAGTINAFSHFLYRLKVGTAITNEAWVRIQNQHVLRMLTSSEKDSYGSGATIYFNVKAVDLFGNESGVSSTSQAASSLNISATDIVTFAPAASKLFPYSPIISGLTLTDNSDDGTPASAAGYIHWTAFSLWHNSIEYSIAAGNTNSFYVYFKDLSTTLLTSAEGTNPQDISTWAPLEDFVLFINDSGTHQKAWGNAIANQIIGSAQIMNAAIATAHIEDLNVTNAKILDMAGNKIILTSSIAINDSTYGNEGWQVEYNSGTPRMYIGDGSDDYFEFDGTNIELSTSKADAIVIKDGADIKLEAGGDIKLHGHATDPSNIFFYDYNNDLVSYIRSQYVYKTSWYPGSDGVESLEIGKSTMRFHNIGLSGEDVTIEAYYDSAHYSYVDMNAGASADDNHVDIYVRSGSGVSEKYEFYQDRFIPNTDEATDLGASANAWDNTYTKTIYRDSEDVLSCIPGKENLFIGDKTTVIGKLSAMKEDMVNSGTDAKWRKYDPTTIPDEIKGDVIDWGQHKNVTTINTDKYIEYLRTAILALNDEIALLKKG